MTLFVDTFTFTRPNAAPVRNAAGETVVAPVDVPRFDHSESGERLGLLVEVGAYFGQADRILLNPGIWESDGLATVLHEYQDEAGAIVRRAIYSDNVRATANAALTIVGHHRLIAALPGFLKNLGGYVRYQQFEWRLAALVTTEAGHPISDASAVDRLILDS